MRFAACLKKDLRLLTGGGLRSLLFLLLPLLLMLIMVFGMKENASADVNGAFILYFFLPHLLTQPF